jgi:hypothetical protein
MFFSAESWNLTVHAHFKREVIMLLPKTLFVCGDGPSKNEI